MFDYVLDLVKYWYKHEILKKPTKFVVFGDFEIKREHARELISAVHDLKLYAGKPFSVVIVGKHDFSPINSNFLVNIVTMDNLNEKEFDKLCRDTDYFFPIFGLSDELFLKLRAYKKPFIVQEKMGYDLNLLEESCVYYENYFELHEYLKRAVFLGPKIYAKMCQKISTERISIFSRKIGA